VTGSGPGIEVSVVVPSLNEADSLPALVATVHETLGSRSYEIIIVDDGSSDDTWEVVKRLRAENACVRGFRLRRNFGKAIALSQGFRAALGRFIVTLDADLQDDPREIPRMLGALEEHDLVVGWKVDRKDPWSRRVLSRLFNGAVAWLTGVRLHDINCGFKAYRAEVARAFPIYGDLFRFIAVFAASKGFRVCEIPVAHHPRMHGRSRYGVGRIPRGFFDLLSVLFLTRFQRSPMYLFGAIGLCMGGLGFLIGAYLSALWFAGEKIGDRPLLLLAVLLLILGIQFFSMGFIGELVAYQLQSRSRDEGSPVREETG